MRTLGGRTMRPILVAAALAVLTTACWPSYGFNYANSRYNPAETQISAANAETLTEAWSFDGVDGSTSTPAVMGDWVYFGSWDGYVRAVSAADGSLQWETMLTTGTGFNPMVDATPTIHGDHVYIGDAQGVLHKVNRFTGALVWSEELDSHAFTRLFGSPVVVEGMVIIGVASTELAVPPPYDYTFRGSVVALDLETGDEVWRVYTTSNDASAGAGVSVWSTPAVDKARKMIYVGTGNTYEEPASPMSDALIAIRYDTGELQWVRQFTEGDVYVIFGDPPQGPDADIGASPNLFSIGNQDVVGVGDKAGVYAVLDRDTGDTVWAVQLTAGSHLGGVMLTSVYANGVVYASSNVMADPYNYNDPANTSVTFALDATDGSIIWQTELPAPSFGALTMANGVLYQPTTPGDLYAFDVADGSVIWSQGLGADLGGGVSVVDGTVFAPWGFWFFGAPANPLGGVTAFRLAQ